MNTTHPATDTGPRQRHRRSLDPRIGDAALAALVTAFAVVALALELGDENSATARSYVVAIVAGGALAVRRVSPPAVLAVVVAGRLFVIWDVDNELALMPAAVVALYTVARHGDRLVGLVTASVAAVVMGVIAAALGDETFALELLGEGAQAFLPIAVADAARARADRIDDLIETEAAARVQAERLRIARDLHDVVAHGLSTIAIQSGVASHLLDRDPGQAKEALDIINATGKSSLEELRAMVGVLRSTDVAELRPTPTDPDDIGELVDAATAAGVPVTCEVTGAFPADVSEAAVVAVHRIVHEALTNVTRHAGSVATTVRLDHNGDHVAVDVHNDRPSGERHPNGSTESTGVGIVGMRERAESVGGHLEARPTSDGGFRVTATVPYYRHGV